MISWFDSRTFARLAMVAGLLLGLPGTTSAGDVPICSEGGCAESTTATSSEIPRGSLGGFFSQLTDTSDFPPRWHCGRWDRTHGWIHIASDLMIWLAYFAIPIVLIYFVIQRRDIPFNYIFLLFGAFIVLCGLTHLCEAVVFWWPAYRLMGLFKGVTAVVSVVTAFMLIPIIPKALSLRSPAELEREVGERMKAEAALRASEARFERAVTGSLNGLWEWSLRENSIWFAPRFQELLGAEHFRSSTHIFGWIARIHPGDSATFVANFCRHLDAGAPCDFEVRMRRSGGDTGWFRVSGIALRDDNRSPLFVSGAIQDITRQKETEAELLNNEQQLRQTHKLAAVDKLAGGVAHEFNNLLQAIGGHLALAERTCPGETLEHLQTASLAVERAGKLTRQLLSFSRVDQLDPHPLDVSETLAGLRVMLSPMFKGIVELQFAVSVVSGAAVRGDANLLQQALLNLCLNGLDAMPHGGILRVNARLVDGASLVRELKPPVHAANWVEITISDQGIGMSADLQERIFEPFFTTKPVGKGTGLGLAVTYGIIKKHQGCIQVESELGSGTTFHVYLPVSDEPALITQRDKESVGGYCQGESILVADDDADVRSLTAEVLRSAGYEVAVAEDGNEAVAKFAASRDKFDLVLLDVMMPGMNGYQAYKEIVALRSDVPALFYSGYDWAEDQAGVVRPEQVTVLEKPVRPGRMLKAIRDVLDSTQQDKTQNHGTLGG